MPDTISRTARDGPGHTGRVKMPRVMCVCGRPIAAGIVAGRPGHGRLWRHDAPDMRSRYGEALVSCSKSLAIVELPSAGRQLELVLDGPGPEPDAEPEALSVLF